MKMPRHLPIILLAFLILGFFYPVWLFGKLPIPADTITGLYHPYRDFFAKEYPRGIPFKNSLITDPVRQQYPWKYYSALIAGYGELPTWNPFNAAGMPLLANFQSSFFYPLNFVLYFKDFSLGWSLLVLLQPFLAGMFMYLYLRNLRLNYQGSFLGGFVFAFCGFSVAWLEWGNMGHTLLWLSLIFLSIDKFFLAHKKNKLAWYLVFTFTVSASLLAGHLQTFFYVYLLSVIYFFSRWLQNGRQKKILLTFAGFNLLFIVLTSAQWLPTLQMISQSAREVDQLTYDKEGWFLPYQNLVQFVAPDFFGNPSTLNYWGVWNYGEFAGYVGIFPLIMAFFALFYRFDKKTLFFGSVFFLSIILALPTIFAKLPFIWKIPLLDTAQPTRLLSLTDFSLSVLAAMGVDFFIRSQKKKILFMILFLFLVFSGIWIFVFSAGNFASTIKPEDISIAKHNLYLPFFVFVLTSVLIATYLFIKSKTIKFVIISLLIVATVFDLFRFAYKFTPFTDSSYLYPETESLYVLRKISGYYRYMTTDSRIFPPNFSLMYFVQGIDVYDPLYLRRYGELIASMERKSPDISTPFGFNRIINPHNYDSRIADLLGVKYVLSLSDISSSKLKEVYHEGETRMYENLDVYDRAFFVKNIISSPDKQKTIEGLFDKRIDLRSTAIVEGWDGSGKQFGRSEDSVDIKEYKSTEVVIETRNKETGFLVFTDSFYPTWHARVCNKNNCVETKIYLTDYNFRGIVVPPGNNRIIFYNTYL